MHINIQKHLAAHRFSLSLLCVLLIVPVYAHASTFVYNIEQSRVCLPKKHVQGKPLGVEVGELCK
jgi:hypothetical protein